MNFLKLKLNSPSKSLLLLPFLAVAAFIVVAVGAQQAGQGLEVTPPSQEIQVDPGQTTTVRATIKNRSNRALPMEVRVEDFTATGEQGQIELEANSPYSVKNWIKLSDSSFSLDPGEDREVVATLTVPEGSAGGRYGSFVFAVSGKKPGAGEAALSQEIASLFLVRVSGPVDEKVALLEFSAPKFSEFGPVSFSTKVKNSGNVFVKTFGLINVTDMFGKKVKDVVVYETNVFPGANRVITAQLPDKWLFGKYNATLFLSYGQGAETLNGTLTFYVFPLRIALVALAVLVVLFFGRKRIGKVYRALMGK